MSSQNVTWATDSTTIAMTMPACPCCMGSGQATTNQVRHFALTWLRRHPYAQTAAYQERVITNQALSSEEGAENDCRD